MSIHRTHRTEEEKRKLSEFWKGKPKSEDHKRKISEAHKKLKKPWAKLRKGKSLSWVGHGIPHTKEAKLKMSNSHKGTKKPWASNIRYWLNKKRPEISGDKSHFWKGGIYLNPYPIDWTKTLKRSIRERDNYTCQICGELQKESTFPIHHIDYVKNNCNPNNLITLCRSCHSKTNHNTKQWKNYFKLKFVN